MLLAGKHNSGIKITIDKIAVEYILKQCVFSFLGFFYYYYLLFLVLCRLAPSIRN